MPKISFITKVSGTGALLHRWLNSVFSDFNSTYFESENKGFLVKLKFGNSHLLIQHTRQIKVIENYNSQYGIHLCKGRIRIYTFWNRLHHMHHSWHRYMVILILTISANLTVQSVQNSSSELRSKYLPVRKNFRSIHAHKVSLLMC